MSPLLIKISKDFATIWTTIDPIGNVAIFAGLTASLTRAERHRTALRACNLETRCLPGSSRSTAFQDQILRPRALVVEGNAKPQNCSMLISTGINSAVPRCLIQLPGCASRMI